MYVFMYEYEKCTRLYEKFHIFSPLTNVRDRALIHKRQLKITTTSRGAWMLL